MLKSVVAHFGERGGGIGVKIETIECIECFYFSNEINIVMGSHSLLSNEKHGKSIFSKK